MTEREAFEAWAAAEGFNIDRDPSAPKWDNYHRTTTRWAWQAWQARGNHAPATVVPEGWALVPVDPPDLMLNSFLTGYGARGGGFNAIHLRDRARRGYQQMLAAVPLAEERGILAVPVISGDVA